MRLEDVKTLLLEAGYEIKLEKRLGNDTGTQLVLADGEKVNVFDSGTVNVQGKGDPQAVKDLLGIQGAHVKKPKDNKFVSQKVAHKQKTKVFVVYGHDKTSRDQLEAMLRRWDL